MLQGNCLDGQRAVFVDNLLLAGVDGMKIDLVVKIVTEQLHLLFQHILQSCRSIDSQPSRTPKKAKGAEHAYQAKAMVAMQMGNEDSTNLGKPQTRTAQLHLRAFTTVHKKQFAPDFHDLRRGIVM